MTLMDYWLVLIMAPSNQQQCASVAFEQSMT